jgi:hypothetical protein
MRFVCDRSEEPTEDRPHSTSRHTVCSFLKLLTKLGNVPNESLGTGQVWIDLDRNGFKMGILSDPETDSPRRRSDMAEKKKHGSSDHHHSAAAHHQAAAHHHLQAAHHHDHGNHDEAKKHASSAQEHSEHADKHTKTAHQHSQK